MSSQYFDWQKGFMPNCAHRHLKPHPNQPYKPQSKRTEMTTLINWTNEWTVNLVIEQRDRQ